MYLYHGSPFLFDRPEPSKGKSYRDFGAGFYLAENEIDAISIALKNSYDGYIYTYEVDENSIFRSLRVREFDSFTDDCLSFIYDNRMGISVAGYDVIIGPTAGDQVNPLFERYRRERPSFDSIVGELRRGITNTRFGIQWCFKNASAIRMLTLVDREPVGRD